jgi:hypothetical protein
VRIGRLGGEQASVGHSIGGPPHRLLATVNACAGVYRPNVDRVFGLDDIVAAHHHMESNEAIGKLVVTP